MLTEQWLSPKMIAEQYSVHRETARRWIKRILGDEKIKGGRSKRPRRLRRIPQSLLEKHLPELMN